MTNEQLKQIHADTEPGIAWDEMDTGSQQNWIDGLTAAVQHNPDDPALAAVEAYEIINCARFGLANEKTQLKWVKAFESAWEDSEN